MRVARLYAGRDGESHFEAIDIPLGDIGRVDRRSQLMAATGILFRETGAEYNRDDWHTTPGRQFMIVLEGRIEIVAGDGTKCQFGPGEVLLAEDTTGRGHISRAVDNQPRTSIWVTLD